VCLPFVIIACYIIEFIFARLKSVEDQPPVDRPAKGLRTLISPRIPLAGHQFLLARSARRDRYAVAQRVQNSRNGPHSGPDVCAPFHGGPVSPILTRPVREQAEHDRVIRLLQVRYRRKFEVAINPGGEQNTSVAVGEMALYPDLVLFGQERGKRLKGTVEVETGESVNTLEALAQWGPFSRLKVPFHLYVPTNALDTARRLCAEHNISVSEIWTYHTALDQVRFTMVHRAAEAVVKPRPTATTRPEKRAERPAARAEKAHKASAASKPEKRTASRTAAKTAKALPRRPQPPTRTAARGAAKPVARKAAGATKRR
jgi:hypothetical protein